MENLQSAVIINSEKCADIIKSRKLDEELEEFEVEALKKFRTALEGIENLKVPMYDAFLMRFLRTRKYNIAAAVKNVKAYSDLVRKNLELMSIPFASHEKFYDAKISTILKNRDEHGRRVLIFRIANWDPKEFTFNQMITAQYFLYEEMTTSIETQKQGIIVILDATNITLSHAAVIAKECTIKNLSRMITLFQGAFPAKFKNMFGVGFPIVLTSVYNLAKFLMKAKLRNRVLLSSSGPDFIHSYISPKILPDFLGGDLSWDEADDFNICKSVLKNEAYYQALFTEYIQKLEKTSNIVNHDTKPH